MVSWRGVWWALSGLVVGMVMTGCQTAMVLPMQTSVNVGAALPVESVGRGDRLSFELPEAWGGAVRCSLSGCLLGAVEHERNNVVLHNLGQDRTVRRLTSYPVPYHPDSAVWLSDSLLAAAVEDGAAVEVFSVVGGKLERLLAIPVGIAPRDVVVIGAEGGRYRLLATPYIGNQVVWIDWQEGSKDFSTKTSVWCKAPWHPAKVSRLPRAGGGVAVACLDDRRVVAVSDSDVLGAPQVLAQFNAVPRQVRPSPSGQWLYVALETGGRNARIHMDSGELQWITAPPTGAVSVAPLDDDVVAWGDDGRILLQRLDVQGGVIESRTLATSGFSTGLQLIDIDRDGVLDLMVLNSAGKQADVIFGPLWEKASQRR